MKRHWVELGRLDKAREMANRLRAIAPTLRPVPDSLVRSVFRNREHSERYMEGLHAATQAA
jgi:hypothetical protein